MKQFNTIIIITVFGLLSCKKTNLNNTNQNNTTQNNATNCNININLIKDVKWIPTSDTNIFATLEYTSSGNYFENKKNIGKWSNVGCDTLKIVGTKNFTSRIYSLSADTLILKNPVFGNLSYHK